MNEEKQLSQQAKMSSVSNKRCSGEKEKLQHGTSSMILQHITTTKQDIVTHSCNTFTDVFQRNFIVTQNCVLQI